MRLIATEPSITATLAALGALDRLVAVSSHCYRLVPEVSDLPRVETTWAVMPEQLLPHQPDLVIMAPPYREGRVEGLLKAGLRVLALTPTDLESIMREARLLGALVGKGSEAEEAIAVMREALGSPVLNGERVYVEIWPNPMMTASQWVYEMIDALGGVPVPPTPNTQVTDEDMLAADPAIIVVAWAGVKKLSTAPLFEREGWQAITAIRDRRVTVVDEIVLNAPGLNLTAGAQELRDTLKGR